MNRRHSPTPEPLAVDLVSPLPPVRSGIADYSMELLPELAARCTVRVLRLPGQPLDAEVEKRWHPVAAARLEGARSLPLYQMGNNRYHRGVHDLALRHPGVLCLHDPFLHHLLMDMTLAHGDLDSYRERLTHDHGWMGEAVAQPPRWGGYGQSALFALPAHRRLVQSQRGVLVHNSFAADLLRQEVEGVSVRSIPMPMPLADPVAVADTFELRRRWGIPDEALLLGSFGFQTPIKRPQSVIRALTHPGLDDVHLLVGGEPAAAVDLDALASRAGVAARVHRTGYLPGAELPVAIAACDLCVNLRYPTAGETSASLLRVFAHGRGAVVSDYAQFREWPREAVLRVPVGEGEDEALARALIRGLADREALRRMGRAARDLVRREHAPARAAAAVVAACEEWRASPPPAPTPARIPPPTSLTWGSLPGEIEVTETCGWGEGERRQVRVRLKNTGLAHWLPGDAGPGGVVLEVRLWVGGEDVLRHRPWVPLPRRLRPGEEHVLSLWLRRPPGIEVRMRVEPHVLGNAGFSVLGGPVWEAAV